MTATGPGGTRYVAFSVAMLFVLQALIVFGFGIETRSRSLEVIEEQPNSLEPAIAQLSRR